MKITKYHVDAFADRLFEGNPAAVCLLEKYADDDLLKAIAAEHNLAETAFVVKQQDHFLIRWFTPTVEVDLCGHATLAAAFVLFNHTSFEGDIIHFKTVKSGSLYVTKRDQHYVMNFPSDIPVRIADTQQINFGVGNAILELYRGKSKYLAILNSEEELHDLNPNMSVISNLDLEGVIFTAPGNDYDFVSRFFCPKIGIDEDPVTGSAHTVLIPFWSERLKKETMTARQISHRGGTVYCTLLNDRVEIAGNARLYSIGELFLAEDLLNNHEEKQSVKRNIL